MAAREAKPRPRFGEDWLVAVLDSLSEGVIAIDGDGCLTAANPAAERLLDFRVTRRRFAPWFEFVPRELLDREGRPVTPHPIERALEGEPTPVTPFAVGQEDRWWELAAHILDPVAGRGSGVVVTFRDVTPRIRAERDRALASEILREVLAMTTHDLRGPILTISGYAGHLAQTHAGTDPELQAGLEAIRRQTGHLTRLVTDLSLTARLEAGALRPEPAEVELGGLIEEALRSTGLGEVTVDATGPVSVRVDPDHGRRIFVNLLDNAVKYGEAPYSVAVRSDGEVVEAAVSDSGAGVPAEIVPRLFDRYSRSAPPGVEGTGLGLAIVSKLAELNGGDVRYDDRNGAGARFVVRLPLASHSDGSGDGRLATPDDERPPP